MHLLVQLWVAVWVTMLSSSRQTVGAAPTSGWIDQPTRVYHCPFNVQANLLEDLSKLQIIYSAIAPNESLFTSHDVICFVRVAFTYRPLYSNAVGVEKIHYSYNGDKNSTSSFIDTKLAWDGNWSPTKYQTVNIASSESTAANTSAVTLSNCGIGGLHQPHEGAELNVQTTFRASLLGPLKSNFTMALRQDLELWWTGECAFRYDHFCRWFDVEGNAYDKTYCKQQGLS
ncbi:hypothetical protein BU24DRAFT_477773 [Aaosphaeria arxii CBS 175.79]|uniref:Uncharacterized protein n=1 Tax=Aaosphaeria arxii CBS 175.79 TaxID=1450172 RepID=A0A6A5XV67_9PLEO|nr:uncharacterized protein BU24DRAFT_477773 [Aaosphaeria arxii CBS 175.79]KAF2016826.1 hypothetical protein BU24DRAFT_477773 [Aaosphaeria arxii CBS 175.79]